MKKVKFRERGNTEKNLRAHLYVTDRDRAFFEDSFPNRPDVFPESWYLRYNKGNKVSLAPISSAILLRILRQTVLKFLSSKDQCFLKKVGGVDHGNLSLFDQDHQPK